MNRKQSICSDVLTDIRVVSNYLVNFRHRNVYFVCHLYSWLIRKVDFRYDINLVHINLSCDDHNFNFSTKFLKNSVLYFG